jgi:hypothetical protein
MMRRFGKEAIAKYATGKLTSSQGLVFRIKMSQSALGLKKITLKGADKDNKTIGTCDINHSTNTSRDSLSFISYF